MVHSERDEDYLLLSLAGIALVFEVLYLFWLLRVVDLPVPTYWRDAVDAGAVHSRTVGTLVEKRLAVRNRSQSSLTWLPMGSGDGVFAKDTVMTGVGASAIFQLSDGSRVELGPNSLIHFPATAQGAAFVEMELNRGKVRLLSAGNKQKVRLRTRSIVVQPESEIVVEAETASAKVSVELVKGEATMPAEIAAETRVARTEPAADKSVDRAVEEVVIHAGDSLRVGDSGIVTVGPTLIKLTPVAPSAGVKLFARTLPMDLHFRWTGEKASTLEVAKGESFANSQRVAIAADSSARAKVGVGRHHWRLVDGKRHSTSFAFDVIEYPRYAQRAPDSTSLKESRKIALRWKPVALAEKYAIEIARDPDFHKVVFTQETTETAVDWTADAPGDFYWRVTAGTAGIDRWPSSEPQHFRVRAQMAAPKPKGAKVLLKPLDKPAEKTKPGPRPNSKDGHGSRLRWFLWTSTVISSALSPSAIAEEKLRMEFNWEAVPGAKRYVLQVSTSAKFGKKPVEIRVNEPRGFVDLPTHPEYFWRVAGIDEEGDLGKFSDVQKMDARPAIRQRLAELAAANQAFAREQAERQDETKKMEEQRLAEERAARDLAAQENRPPEPAKPTYVRQIKLGYGGGGVVQQTSSGVSQVRTMGHALNYLRAGLLIEKGNWLAEAKVGFQPWYFSSNNPEIAAFQPPLSAGRWDFGVLARRKSSPWYGGLRVRLEAELQKIGPETMAAGTVGHFALVAGRRWQLLDRTSIDGSDGLSLTTQLELAPIGPRRGGGLDISASYGFGQFFGDWTPIFEISLYPYYRQGSTSQRPEWTVEWNGWWFLAWKIDDPPPSVATATVR